MKKENTKKKYKPLAKANLYIYAGQNNTMFTLTDLMGNVIAIKSPKVVGFKNCKKSTTFAAQMAAKAIKDIIVLCNNPQLNVIFSGPGNAKESLMSFSDSDIKIMSIEERFSSPFNGPRQKRMRRL